MDIRTIALALLSALREEAGGGSGDVPAALDSLAAGLARRPGFMRRDLMAAAQRALVATRHESGPARSRLVAWRRDRLRENERRYGSHLHSETPRSALVVA